jgi:hypothetical protein
MKVSFGSEVSEACCSSADTNQPNNGRAIRSTEFQALLNKTQLSPPHTKTSNALSDSMEIINDVMKNTFSRRGDTDLGLLNFQI